MPENPPHSGEQVRQSSPDETKPRVLTPQQARQGVRGNRVIWVLGISLAAAAVALFIVWLVFVMLHASPMAIL